MGLEIDVHFNRLGPSGATLVVVAVGREVFGATNPEPLAALHTAAREAAEGLAKCGHRVDAEVIVERGHEEWNARVRRSVSRR